MDCYVTGVAYDQALAMACCHDFHPLWSLSSPFVFQVRQLAYMVDTDVLARSAQLAFVGE